MSLMDFGSKPASKSNTPPPVRASSPDSDYSFGAFQNASSAKADSFYAPPPTHQPAPAPAPAPAKSGPDPLDILFSSSSNPSGASPEATGSFPEANDWDLGAEFAAHDDGGTTTELEGLPPPPSGVSASAAKVKGMDNYKQGQYADAIKWLTWAVVLLEKSSDSVSITEVLSCRASSYKEVGEYKKAISDCSKVLEWLNFSFILTLNCTGVIQPSYEV